MGIYDFLNKTKAAGGDIYDGMKEAGQAAASAAKGAWSRIQNGPTAQPGTAAPDTSGMRGSADVQPRMSSAAELAPEAKVGAPETLPGNSQVVKERLAAATAKPLNPVEGTAAAPGVRGVATPPDAPSIGPGRPSPEAQAFRASRVAPPAPPAPPAGGTPPGTPPEVPGGPGRFGRIGKLAGGAAKGLGVAGAVLGGVDAVDKAVSGTTPEQKTGQGGAVLGGVMEAYDNLTFGQGRKFAHGVKGAITGAGEGGNGLRDRMSNIAGGFGKGWNEGAAMEAAAAAAAPGTAVAPAAASAIPGGEAAKAAGAPQNSGDGIPTLRGTSVSPESLIAGNAVPALGYGAFKRTGGEAVGIHAPATEADKEAGLGARARPGTAPGGAGGVGGAIAKLYSAGAEGRAAALNRDYQLKAGSQRIAMMQLQNKLQQEGRERNNATIDSIATAKMEATGAATNDKDYGRNLEREKAKHRDEFVYSASQRDDKRNFGDLNDQEVQQLADLKKLKDNVESGRSSITAGLRDWFGISRTDSRNLYSYAPKIKEAATLPGSGGTVFTLANGNKVTATAAKGGGFNFIGPNNAVDADIDRMMNAAVEQYQTKGKK